MAEQTPLIICTGQLSENVRRLQPVRTARYPVSLPEILCLTSY